MGAGQEVLGVINWFNAQWCVSGDAHGGSGLGVITPWPIGVFTPNLRSMTTTNSPQIQPQGNAGSCCTATHDEVARVAFSLYEKHGSQDGHDVRNWLDAEAHVKSKHTGTRPGRQAAERPVGQSAR